MSYRSGPPWHNPDAPVFVVARVHAEAEAWAFENIPGMVHADYSGTDLEVANEINRVVSDIATKLGVQVPAIAPSFWSGWPGIPPRHPPMFSSRWGIGYDPVALTEPGKTYLLGGLASRSHVTAASRTLSALVAHEMAHVLSARPAAAPPERARTQARILVNRYRRALGATVIRAELGDYAWVGGPDETWAEAFSAYWDEVYSLRVETRDLVENVLNELFPEVAL